LNSLGFSNVIHQNRDFYADVKNNTIPKHDVLVTNPPYSGDSKERVLEFCAASTKPWLLLLPNYVANKEYFSKTMLYKRPLFVVPKESYVYEHPQGTGKDAPPFYSLWYCGLNESTDIAKKVWYQSVCAK
jgi:hypothetical protein